MASSRNSELLRNWIKNAESLNELIRVNEEVDWDEELCAITYMVGKNINGPTLLFEKIKDYDKSYSIITNMPGASVDRVAIGLGLPTGLSMTEIINIVKDKYKHRIEPIEIDNQEAPINENVLYDEDVDLYQFPAPKTFPLDGGRYLGTCDALITRNLETGNINVGTYRNMVLSKNQLGFYVSPGKDALLHREQSWKKGEPCEVAIAFGIDPLLYFVASQSFPKNVSEYEFAGGILGEPYPVTKGYVVDLPIPAYAEIVVEGLSYPNETLPEGPFSEFPGYYGRPEESTPYVQVKCVHYRDNPILSTAVMSDHNSGCATMMSIARSARIWDDLEKLGVPGIVGVCSHTYAIFGLVVVSMEQRFAGHASQVLALASQCTGGAYYTKWIVVVDEDIDPTNIHEVIWAMSTRCNPVEDLDFLRKTWSTYLDPTINPAEERPYGMSKCLINACKEYKYINTFAKRGRIRKEVYDRIVGKWNKLNLPNDPPIIITFEK